MALSYFFRNFIGRSDIDRILLWPVYTRGDTLASSAAQALDARLTNHVVAQSVNPALGNPCCGWRAPASPRLVAESMCRLKKEYPTSNSMISLFSIPRVITWHLI